MAYWLPMLAAAALLSHGRAARCRRERCCPPAADAHMRRAQPRQQPFTFRESCIPAAAAATALSSALQQGGGSSGADLRLQVAAAACMHAAPQHASRRCCQWPPGCSECQVPSTSSWQPPARLAGQGLRSGADDLRAAPHHEIQLAAAAANWNRVFTSRPFRQAAPIPLLLPVADTPVCCARSLFAPSGWHPPCEPCSVSRRRCCCVLVSVVSRPAGDRCARRPPPPSPARRLAPLPPAAPLPRGDSCATPSPTPFCRLPGAAAAPARAASDSKGRCVEDPEDAESPRCRRCSPDAGACLECWQGFGLSSAGECLACNVTSDHGDRCIRCDGEDVSFWPRVPAALRPRRRHGCGGWGARRWACRWGLCSCPRPPERTCPCQPPMGVQDTMPRPTAPVRRALTSTAKTALA